MTSVHLPHASFGSCSSALVHGVGQMGSFVRSSLWEFLGKSVQQNGFASNLKTMSESAPFSSSHVLAVLSLLYSGTCLGRYRSLCGRAMEMPTQTQVTPGQAPPDFRSRPPEAAQMAPCAIEDQVKLLRGGLKQIGDGSTSVQEDAPKVFDLLVSELTSRRAPPAEAEVGAASPRGKDVPNANIVMDLFRRKFDALVEGAGGGEPVRRAIDEFLKNLTGALQDNTQRHQQQFNAFQEAYRQFSVEERAAWGRLCRENTDALTQAKNRDYQALDGYWRTQMCLDRQKASCWNHGVVSFVAACVFAMMSQAPQSS